MFRRLPTCSWSLKSKINGIFHNCNFATANSSQRPINYDTLSMRDPQPVSQKYIRVGVATITFIIGLRLISALINRENDEGFSSALKSNAFSWPQHYNIFLPRNRLDVNEEDDEIGG
ncbi:unnamed protein product [Thelazia callipaeda]|uniref:Deltamethrin resistance protein prag01 domain-containing protein n=1 Tax=Thelazia callipaeda TaxID=103827 RepID=A0A0N5CZK0_THECL|nr:unnamed protein product [Thelazia callipaeda]